MERSLGWLVFSVLVAGAAGPTRGTHVLAATADSQSALILRLTGADRLSPFSKVALQKQVESIWRAGQVRVRWLGSKPDASAAPALTILVTPRALASCCADGLSWTVGELLRFEGASAIAVASITGAQRVVDESQRFRLLDHPFVHEHRLGVVLGRAVAHEIGHYLLRTNTHAQYGLMRANIDVREFADPRADSFRLDRAAEAHLALLAARGRLSTDIGQQEFSYTR